MVASPGVWSTIAGHFGTANFSNCCRHGQLLFDLQSREEDDFELKRPRDEARFFGLLKKADGPVTIFFFQDGDDRREFVITGHGDCPRICSATEPSSAFPSPTEQVFVVFLSILMSAPLTRRTTTRRLLDR